MLLHRTQLRACIFYINFIKCVWKHVFGSFPISSFFLFRQFSFTIYFACVWVPHTIYELVSLRYIHFPFNITKMKKKVVDFPASTFLLSFFHMHEAWNKQHKVHPVQLVAIYRKNCVEAFSSSFFYVLMT